MKIKNPIGLDIQIKRKKRLNRKYLNQDGVIIPNDSSLVPAFFKNDK
jgi:hypothetical protein